MKTVHLRDGETLTVRWPLTGRHLIKGFPRSCATCPVALSLKDIFPDLELHVNSVGIHLKEGEIGETVLFAYTSEEICQVVNLVDAGMEAGPHRFELTFTAWRDFDLTYDDTK